MTREIKRTFKLKLYAEILKQNEITEILKKEALQKEIKKT